METSRRQLFGSLSSALLVGALPKNLTSLLKTPKDHVDLIHDAAARGEPIRDMNFTINRPIVFRGKYRLTMENCILKAGSEFPQGENLITFTGEGDLNHPVFVNKVSVIGNSKVNCLFCIKDYKGKNGKFYLGDVGFA